MGSRNPLVALGTLSLLASACPPYAQPTIKHPGDENYPLACAMNSDHAVHEYCLRADGDVYRVNPALLRSLAPSAKRLFSLRSDATFLWARADGLARPTPTFDNWADYYCAGLTRTLQGTRMGFMNAQLEVVVPPSYEFATMFRGGRAAVCNECHEPRSEEDSLVSCVKCSIIDVQGRVLSAQEQPSEVIWGQLPEPQAGECVEP